MPVSSTWRLAEVAAELDAAGPACAARKFWSDRRQGRESDLAWFGLRSRSVSCTGAGRRAFPAGRAARAVPRRSGARRRRAGSEARFVRPARRGCWLRGAYPQLAPAARGLSERAPATARGSSDRYRCWLREAYPNLAPAARGLSGRGSSACCTRSVRSLAGAGCARLIPTRSCRAWFVRARASACGTRFV